MTVPIIESQAEPTSGDTVVNNVPIIESASMGIIDKIGLAQHLPLAKRIYNSLSEDDRDSICDLINRYAPEHSEFVIKLLENSKTDARSRSQSRYDDEYEDDDYDDAPENTIGSHLTRDMYVSAIVDAAKMWLDGITPGYAAEKINQMYGLNWNAVTLTKHVNRYLNMQKLKAQKAALSAVPQVSAIPQPVKQGIVRKFWAWFY